MFHTSIIAANQPQVVSAETKRHFISIIPPLGNLVALVSMSLSENKSLAVALVAHACFFFLSEPQRE